ncbi:acetyl-CoA hydrolase [Bradyrhizobium sp. USDA 4532]|uniref:CaiB/BaiF CoA transferase family protein n=1 Tax=unclassified Bradyrhizobium TaxID=2631580 RepID=UPI00209CD0EB|nr:MULTISPECIES: CaiB/BaiF CoA-transferase family protein [unclassified Bradyrhizobium]MCP1835512.1 acetyl-CoA hydrolase [Bradyrhizobium sp. USDA 4545]MCP1920259.1 acetyl-CoA hydrolase [Bradyrhizobium sp. USDA 4532]
MGVLDGLKVVEMASLGPAPACGMLLADLGADVINVERPAADAGRARPAEIYNRGKRSIILDLKKPGAIDTALKLVEGSDALIEGMRPGVMERLGLGPDVCLACRPSLVYGRMTGWGQYGPLMRAAGHDGNYVALSGALWLATASGQRPEPPPSLLGDMAGGALYLAIGVVAGVLRARKDGRGQVVDAAMVDGSAHLLNLLLSIIPSRVYKTGKPASDGQPFARSYRCSDGEWVNICAIEPQFYAELIKRLGLDGEERFVGGLMNAEVWPDLTDQLARVFASKTRSEWCKLLEGTDACFAPVLSPPEAAVHPHNVARGVYAIVDGILQAGPAPRFSATPSNELSHVPVRGAHTREVLSKLKLTPQQIKQLTKSGALGPPRFAAE